MLQVYARFVSTGNASEEIHKAGYKLAIYRATCQSVTSPLCKMVYFVCRIGLDQVFVGRLGLELELGNRVSF